MRGADAACQAFPRQPLGEAVDVAIAVCPDLIAALVSCGRWEHVPFVETAGASSASSMRRNLQDRARVLPQYDAVFEGKPLPQKQSSVESFFAANELWMIQSRAR